MIKTAIFKVRLDFEGCDIVATTYPNQRIPFSVFSDLHNSIHDTVKEINNQKSWRTRLNYVYSSKTGESFIQYFTDIKVFPCEKCCFFKGEECNWYRYFEGDKGSCKFPYKKTRVCR